MHGIILGHWGHKASASLKKNKQQQQEREREKCPQSKVDDTNDNSKNIWACAAGEWVHQRRTSALFFPYLNCTM